MSPDIQREAIKLFSCLEYGEQLAYDCALEQSKIIESKKSQRFLKVQALQEFMHAKFYNKAIDHIDSRNKRYLPKSLIIYADRLRQAMVNKDVTDYLVGSQVVLEGFGEQLLLNLNIGLDKHDVGFKRIRKLIIRQEQSHHAFGIRALKSQLEEGKVKSERIGTLMSEYLYHVQCIINEMEEVFYYFDERPEDYYEPLIAELPDWLKGTVK